MSSISFCLPIGENDPPCFTLFSHLYAEHRCGRGILGFLNKKDAYALKGTCREAEQEVRSFHWNQFIERVKRKASQIQYKESYWTSLIEQAFSHIPIKDIISVIEIEPYNYLPNYNIVTSDKEYLVELIADDWIVPGRKPLRVFINVEYLKITNTNRINITTYNNRRDSKIKEHLIDNRLNHVMTYCEFIHKKEIKNKIKMFKSIPNYM